MYYEYYQETNPTFHVLEGQTFERANYTNVYNDMVTREQFADVDDDYEVLEYLFAMHNAGNRPRNQEIRSMSVGDIVVIERGNHFGEADEKVVKAYVCDNFGWKEIEFNRYQ